MRKDQIDVAIRGGDVDSTNGPSTFGISNSSNLKWPKGIVPYVLSDSVSECLYTSYPKKHNFQQNFDHYLSNI